MDQGCNVKQAVESGASGQGYWSEIGIEKKVERTRKIVKSLQGQLNRLNDLIDAFEDHSHSEGKIMVPFTSRRWNKNQGESMDRGPGKDDVYF